MKKCIGFFLCLMVAAILPLVASAADTHGVTADGTFFVAKSLVDQAEGEEVYLRADLTGWKDQKMTVQGSFYVAQTGKKVPDGPTAWCVHLGGDRFLPHELVKLGVETSGTKSNGRGGYNWVTAPTSFPGK